MDPNRTRLTVLSGLGAPGETGDDEAFLVQLRGPTLGRRFPLPMGQTVIGRHEGCPILIDADSVSRTHCALSITPGTSTVRDLGSTNGTFVNDVKADGEVPLRPGDQVRVGPAIFKFLRGGLSAVEAAYHEEIYRLTILDALTQVHNKRYLLELLEREMARASRHGRALSVVLLDVDHFKRINDTHGHLAGDFVLRELAAALRPRVRKDECLARYGGEEFALVLPETPPSAACSVAEALRTLVEKHAFRFEGQTVPVTFSAGVASLLPAHETPASLIAAADERLYEAKRAGRNRVVGQGSGEAKRPDSGC